MCDNSGMGSIVHVLALTLALSGGEAPSGAVVVRAPTGEETTALEAEARAAAATRLALLDEAGTRAFLERAAGLGLSCDLVENECLAAFAQLIGVDEVVLVQLERVAGAPFARVARVHGRGAFPPRRVAGRLEDPATGAPGTSPAALVGGLFDVPVVATVPVRVAVVPADAVLLLDEAPLDRVGGVAWVTPGTHVLRARTASSSAERTIVVPADGNTLDVALAVDPGPPAPPPAPPPASPPSPPPEEAAASVDVVPILTVAGGALGAILGGVLLASAEDALSAPMSLEDRSRLQALGLAGGALVLVGGAAVATAATLWVLP